jgi:sphingomyelin phosphodiesterase
MLEYIPSVADKFEFGILTGDVPPHEVWSTLPYNKTQLIESSSYDLMHVHFDTPGLIDTKLYPTIGNHEAAPTNLFPHNQSKIPKDEDKQHLNLTWLYQTLSESWDGWLETETTQQVVHNSGSYVAYPTDGLVLIGLNTMFCYNLNWWNIENGGEKVKY